MINSVKKLCKIAFMAIAILTGSGASHLAFAGTSDALSLYWGKIQGVWFQGPVRTIPAGMDRLADLSVLSQVVGLSAQPRNTEMVYQYHGHTLDAQAGRRAALLDGRVILLASAPVLKDGHLLMPLRQSLTLLTVPYREEDGVVNILSVTDSWKRMQSSSFLTEGGKAELGYIGLLSPDRLVLAVKPRVFGKTAGFGTLYEGKWVSSKELAVNKLRPLTDTSTQIYMEYLPNGNVMQNLFQDSRPEVMVVETCSCAGRYNYATMFTVTEMGLTSIWHSQYSYDRIERTGKGWELISYRKETVSGAGGVLPYWEVHETWMGTQFSIIKEIYHAPQKQ